MDFCTPFFSNTLILGQGETSGVPILTCNPGDTVRPIVVSFTRPIGETDQLIDLVTCVADEADVKITDQTISPPPMWDTDGDSTVDEDPIDGLDNDADTDIDEDPPDILPDDGIDDDGDTASR